jgi:hypothetical protein
MNISTFVATGLALFAVLFFLGHCLGCGETQLKSEAADFGYKAQQSACVQRYRPKADIDACRDRVKKDWTVPKDAGPPEAGRTLNIGFDNDGGAR